MKQSLNQTMKERYFALYYGQRVIACVDSNNEFLSKAEPEYAKTEGFYLMLRSKRSLTDGELLRISAFLDIKPEYKTAKDMRKIISMGDGWGNTSITRSNHVHVRDELVTMGIAVEFMGYSVSELVDVGWIKLVAEEVV